MENPDTITSMLAEISMSEVLRSLDIKFLNKCRTIYETTEEYEKCALIRDRIKKIEDANNSNR